MVLRKLPLLCCVLLFSTSALADGFRLVNHEGRQSEYAGNLSLSGRFERRQDSETLDWRGDRICFYPEAADAAKLPATDNKGGARFFCFSNHRAAAEQLQLAATPPSGSCGVTGTATVAISQYTVETGGNVFDQAWLDRVEKSGDVTPLACH